MAWPLAAGHHVAGFGAAVIFLWAKVACEVGMVGRRHHQACYTTPVAPLRLGSLRQRRALVQNLFYVLDTTCILRGDDPYASS